MAYQDLTIEERQILDDFMTMLRPWCGEFARLHNKGAAIYTQYWASISSIVNQIQDSDLVPNKTGNSGAVGVTKSEIGTILAWIESIATLNSEQNRQLMAKSAGGSNLVNSNV